MTRKERYTRPRGSVEYNKIKFRIVPYQDSWPLQFESIREEIVKHAGIERENIHHVGSTSIPRMSGKPTIDVVATIPYNKEQYERIARSLSRIGFECYRYPGEHRFFLYLEMDGVRIAQIHLGPRSNRRIATIFKLMELLSKKPDIAESYSREKMRLFELHADNYELYRSEKNIWLRELKKRHGIE